MISRIADHCFWFGRYLERAESTARVLHVTGNLALDAELTQAQCWEPVLIVADERARFDEVFGAGAEVTGDRVEELMSLREENPVSLVSSIAAARDNARSIREVVSLEVWQTINELYLWVTSDEARRLFETDRYGFYRHIRKLSSLALGLLHGTMLHDRPLDFIWLGVLLERAGQTARTLDIHHALSPSLLSFHPVVATALWLSLLRACSGFEPFMKRQQGRVTGDAASAFLLLEPSFPRSVRFCVRNAGERLTAIRSPELPGLPGERAQVRLRLLDSKLAWMSPEDLRGDATHAALSHILEEVSGVCDAVGSDLLGRSPAPASTSTSTSPPAPTSQRQG
jgi:uncharacterized alpha-E superfamily protein